MKRLFFRVRKVSFFPIEAGTGGVPAALDLAFVPAMQRRKLSVLEKLALAAMNAVAPASAGTSCDVVFASRFGEWRRTVRLLTQLHEEHEISPTGFMLSVHNAAPAVFSLLRGDTAPYTAIAAGTRTLENGLFQAILLRRRVIFVFAEEPVPEFYANDFSEKFFVGSLALLIEPDGNEADGCAERRADGNDGCEVGGNDFPESEFFTDEGVAGTPPLSVSALTEFLGAAGAAARLETAAFTLVRRKD